MAKPETSNRQAHGDQDAKERTSKVQFLEITEDSAGQRIDNFLCARLKGVPRTRIYRIVRKGEVRVNKGRIKADYKLQSGDVVRVPPIRVAEANELPQAGKGLKEALEQAVLYEDDSLLIINKPSGLAVHGGSGIKLGLIETLRQLRPEARFLELVHRLDRDTSGCVMVAKKRSMLRYLHDLLRTNGVTKHYQALVVGKWPTRKHKVDVPLQKNTLQSGERMVVADPDGKPSLTRYEVRQRFSGYTLVQAYPVSGRTHQIRVHCQFAGHSIAGDDKYTDEDTNKRLKAMGLRRLFLHAESLAFKLPETGKLLRVEAPLDEQLQSFLTQLQK
ncbi:Ribosomal large subunit pseudouridine synthase C [gamma proteobacterium IMCC2047]|nr:Ribosomal large subunit pseudouridine synthase C [gamma proteobacterium IMCC2047]